MRWVLGCRFNDGVRSVGSGVRVWAWDELGNDPSYFSLVPKVGGPKDSHMPWQRPLQPSRTRSQRPSKRFATPLGCTPTPLRRLDNQTTTVKASVWPPGSAIPGAVPP